MALTFLPKRRIGTENFTSNKNETIEKLKSALKEIAKAAIIKTGLIMRKNRSYIYTELSIMKRTLDLTPGLLGPKFPQIISALSFAKNEIINYFSHLNQSENIKPDLKKFYYPEHYVDYEVVNLLSLVFEMVQFIEKFYTVIVEYNTEYLSFNDYQILLQYEEKLESKDFFLKPLLRNMNGFLSIFVDDNQIITEYLEENDMDHLSIINMAEERLKTFNVENQNENVVLL